MKLIDIHCHVNFKDFKDDADEVIDRALLNNTAMIVVGAEWKTSNRAIDYANKYSTDIYAAIGIHPVHLEDMLNENHDNISDYKFISHREDFDYQKYYDLAKANQKIVAIGEIGLDYFHLPHDRPELEVKRRQQEVFQAQLKLANDLKLPVIIHCREAHHDLLPILTHFKGRGVIHCFSGDLALANEYIKLGLMISFTGLITFAHQWDEVIKQIPLDKIMIETDSPWLTPLPYRGKRNEPLHVVEVARKIAAIKGITLEEVADITYKNAQKLFGIN